MLNFSSPTVRHAEYLGATVLILIVLSLTVWYMATHRAPSSLPEETASSTPTANAEPQTIAEHAQYYDISATLPSETPLLATVGSSANAKAIASMRDFIDTFIHQFKSEGNFDSLTKEDVQMMGFDQGRKENLEITYKEVPSTHAVSYVYSVYLDTLGAHPNAFFKTFVFDAKTGSELTLSQVFLPKVAYLKRLSAITQFELEKSLGEFADHDYIADGTKPENDSFQDWYLTDTDLVILFPPYQVAAYAAGTQTVTIPLSQLKDIVKPSYLP